MKIGRMPGSRPGVQGCESNMVSVIQWSQELQIFFLSVTVRLVFKVLSLLYVCVPVNIRIIMIMCK